jgi:hypothetical protein
MSSKRFSFPQQVFFEETFEIVTAGRKWRSIFAVAVNGDQSDQIGRIFAYWAIVHFGQFLENYHK